MINDVVRTEFAYDIASFPSLMAFCAKGDTLPAVAGYQAYRRGAVQTFLGGESILYRRSNLNPTWEPNSAGLPDVVLGAIGLAELLSPGVVDRMLALDMSGTGIQLGKHGGQLELSWPQIGKWRLQASTNLPSWADQPGLPNPYLFNPDEPKRFFRIMR